MMNIRHKIFKYTMYYNCVTGAMEVTVPLNSTILDFQLQGDTLVAWAEVQPEAPACVKRVFLMVPTGADIPQRDAVYYKTIIFPNGLVFHFYKVLHDDDIPF